MQGNQDINVRSVFFFIRGRGFVTDDDVLTHFDAHTDPVRAARVAEVIAELQDKRNMIDRAPRGDQVNGLRLRAKITKRSVYMTLEGSGASTHDEVAALFDTQGDRSTCWSRVFSALRALVDEGTAKPDDAKPPRFSVCPRDQPAKTFPN